MLNDHVHPYVYYDVLCSHLVGAGGCLAVLRLDSKKRSVVYKTEEAWIRVVDGESLMLADDCLSWGLWWWWW